MKYILKPILKIILTIALTLLIAIIILGYIAADTIVKIIAITLNLIWKFKIDDKSLLNLNKSYCFDKSNSFNNKDVYYSELFPTKKSIKDLYKLIWI